MFVLTTNKVIAMLLLLIATCNQLFSCINLRYPRFPHHVAGDFIVSGDANIMFDALLVTGDVRGQPLTHLAGRILHKKRLRLWNENKIASFNSTFVLNVTPQPDGGGDGIACVLTKDFGVPANSDGQWLGIVNANRNGSSDANIVAVEFDTKKSFSEDIDDNHIGLNINSVYSEKQASLNGTDISFASGINITAMIIYNGETKIINVLVFKGNNMESNTGVHIIAMPLDLRKHIYHTVYVGFSASTGTGSELNCIRSWYFQATDLDKSDNPLWIWIAIAVGITTVTLLCGFVGYVCWRKIRKVSHVIGDGPTIQGIETGLSLKKIKLRDLKTATSNFNTKNELGRGGFGIVYKGDWDGNPVAVKRIINTPQGKQNLIAEVTTIGSLHHKNLVKLIGWCYESNELLLAYEFMPNGSLDHLIYRSDKTIILSWERRYNIICGVAQALDYLHNECSKRVLHRDIKASNIMLDSEFNACLGDFGLARMFKLSEKTHYSTIEIAGTPGYMAPEIFHTGRTTAETDIYAFGVLTLVLACGKKPGVLNEEGDHTDSIIDWVWNFYKLDLVIDAIDPRLNGNFNKEQAECMLVLGLACCNPNPYMRPSMKTALQVLTGEDHLPLVPCEKPVFMWPVTAPCITSEESNNEGVLTAVSSFIGR